MTLQVIRKLKLDKDPEFVGKQGSVEDPITNAIETFESLRKVTRVGATYILQIDFLSKSPQKAAQIANALARAYIAEVLEAKYQANERATEWLQSRIPTLTAKWTAAERAAVEYKDKSKIVATNNGQADEQLVGNLNNQLAVARGQLVEAAAKLKRIKAIMSSDTAQGDVTDALQNPVISQLRVKYLDAEKKSAFLSRKYGSEHTAVRNLRAEMDDLRNSLRSELQRIERTYQSEYEIAVFHEQAIAGRLEDATKQSSATEAQRVKLRELMSNAETYRTLAASFLSRYTEGVQQQSFPIAEARVITEARPASRKTSPKTLLSLAIGLFVGMAGGTAAAFIREQLDRSFRTPEEVEQTLGLPCLGMLQSLSEKEMSTASLRNAERLRACHNDGRAHYLGASEPMARFAVLSPFSRFAETIRASRLAAERHKLEARAGAGVIAVVSALSGEGKTMFASNLALTMANAGKPTLLIDLDLRKPNLSKLLTPRAESGFLEALAGNLELAKSGVVEDVETKLLFLPTVTDDKWRPTADVVTSNAFRKLVDNAVEAGMSVVLDVPPLALISDAKALVDEIDAFLVVVEWGRTPRDLVQRVLTSSDHIMQKTCGVVLNKVDFSLCQQVSSLPHDYFENPYFEKLEASPAAQTQLAGLMHAFWKKIDNVRQKFGQLRGWRAG